MNIYLIAGPPGIGKSTNARKLIPKRASIVDEDLAGYQYKKQGFNDFQFLASMSTNRKIRENLFADRDFALELNLGFSSHYDYLKSIASAAAKKKIHLLLFFTDDPELCLTRARVRYARGGHEVKPEVVTEMYQNTFPLFEQNKNLFHSVRLVDVTDRAVRLLTRKAKSLPAWVTKNGLESYLA